MTNYYEHNEDNYEKETFANKDNTFEETANEITINVEPNDEPTKLGENIVEPVRTTKITYSFDGEDIERDYVKDNNWKVITDNKKTRQRKEHKKLSTPAILGLCLVISLVSGITGGKLNSVFLNRNTNTTTIQNASTQLVSVQNVSVKSNGVLTVSEIANKVQPAVVSITIQVKTQGMFGSEQISEGSGSGIILTEDGYIVTNHHVVADASSIKVKLSTGQEYTATMIGSDEETDLAVIKINASSLPYVILGDSSLLKIGDLAVAIGNPLGELSGTVTSGIISATDRTIPVDNGVEMTVLQTDASINQGNSGGALVNQFGEVIGIVNAKSMGLGIEGLGFAIPVNHAKSIINDLMSKGYVTGRTTLGINTQEVPQEYAMFYRMTPGVYVISLVENGPSAKSGVKTGDRIISLAGKTVATNAELKKIKEEHSIGDTLSMVVERNGEKVDLKITLTEDRQG